jgi:hypothetical protein
MAAPEGNQFWKIRSKHGRDRLFATPQLLWEAACEYFEWIEENPLIQIDFKGKDADRVEIPHTMPFTIQGLCIYMNCNTLYFRDFEVSIQGKEDQLSKDFSQIIHDIKQIIYNQKFSGASCGFYNANIIARDLGLVEKSESSVKTDVTANIVVSDAKTAASVQDMIDKFEKE